MSENLSSISAVSCNSITATAAIDIPTIGTSDICQDIHILLDRIIQSMQEVTQ